MSSQGGSLLALLELTESDLAAKFYNVALEMAGTPWQTAKECQSVMALVGFGTFWLLRLGLGLR